MTACARPPRRDLSDLGRYPTRTSYLNHPLNMPPLLPTLMRGGMLSGSLRIRLHIATGAQPPPMKSDAAVAAIHRLEVMRECSVIIRHDQTGTA